MTVRSATATSEPTRSVTLAHRRHHALTPSSLRQSQFNMDLESPALPMTGADTSKVTIQWPATTAVAFLYADQRDYHIILKVSSFLLHAVTRGPFLTLECLLAAGHRQRNARHVALPSRHRYRHQQLEEILHLAPFTVVCKARP